MLHRDLVFPNFRNFRSPESRLSTFDAMWRSRDLDDTFETYFLFNRQVKRDDPTGPWDLKAVQRNGGRVAPAHDDDLDKRWRDHK